MKKHALLFLVFFPLSLSAQKLDISAIDAYTVKVQKDWEVPGIAIGIIYNDTVVLAKGFGTLSATDNTPVDANTLFGIASNTKSFTAAALAIMVDKNKLQWDDKVIHYLPYFRLYNEYVSQEMTVRDLLCHRSGLKTFAGDLIWYNSEHSKREIIERARFLKPVYGFRSHYGYSNIMYLAAGEVLAEIAGKSWETVIEEEFFKPLGMTRSNTSISKQKNEKNIAVPHAKVEGKWIPIPYVNWDNIAPAGGINSCINDMMKWMKLQLHSGEWNEKVIWSEARTRDMWSSHTVESISAFSEKLHPTKHFHTYGLGWDLFDFYGYKIVNHSGGLDGMVSHTFMIPELNIGCVILTNSATGAPYILMHQILEIIIGDPVENDWSTTYLELSKAAEEYQDEKAKEVLKSRRKDILPTLPIANYCGMYSGNVYGNAKVELIDGQMNLKLMHTPSFYGKLTHYEENTFSIKFAEHPSLPEGKVTFVLDNDKQKVMVMVVDVPNPDFDFTELDFNKIR